jgi:hypothetical protein
VPVAGVVTLDGEPVSGGAVRVIPQKARAATGAIGPDGRFTLGTFTEADGCVVGTHVVEVMPPPTGGDERSPAPAKPASFPTHYISADTSGLTITITGSTSDLVISLTK